MPESEHPKPASPQLVSVVIPTRDRHVETRAAVASVAAQTHRPCEVIVVDDGSTRPVTIDELVAPCWLNVKVVRMDGAGASAARNYGAALAKGEVLAFLDSDDRWRPDKLADDFVAGCECNLVVSGYEVDGTGRSSVPSAPVGAAPGYWLTPAAEPVCCSGLTLPKSLFEALGGFEISLRNLEDLDLVLAAARLDRVRCTGAKAVLKGTSRERLYSRELAAISRRALLARHREALTNERSARTFQALLLAGHFNDASERQQRTCCLREAARSGAVIRSSIMYGLLVLAPDHAPTYTSRIASLTAQRLMRWLRRGAFRKLFADRLGASERTLPGPWRGVRP